MGDMAALHADKDLRDSAKPITKDETRRLVEKQLGGKWARQLAIDKISGNGSVNIAIHVRDTMTQEEWVMPFKRDAGGNYLAVRDDGSEMQSYRAGHASQRRYWPIRCGFRKRTASSRRPMTCPRSPCPRSEEKTTGRLLVYAVCAAIKSSTPTAASSAIGVRVPSEGVSSLIIALLGINGVRGPARPPSCVLVGLNSALAGLYQTRIIKGLTFGLLATTEIATLPTSLSSWPARRATRRPSKSFFRLEPERDEYPRRDSTPCSPSNRGIFTRILWK